MSTSRLETFCDGVFAIAVTLLVLIIEPPTSDSLAHGLAHQWPSYLAYAVSFLTIGIMWVNHHEVMRQVAHTDWAFLYINIFFLMTIAFLPYPTRIVALHIRGSEERTAALFYGLTMIVIAFAFLALWLYPSSKRRLLRADADPAAIRGITRSFVPGVPLYTGATLVALVSPTASLLCFAALALFYVAGSVLLARP
jgi:TMEM175 potassium channel family protein